MNWFDVPREKYWAPPASYSKEKIISLTDELINSGDYLCSEKIDGNWCAFICQSGVCKMQTRGVSTVTGTYGEVQEKVPEIFEVLKTAFGQADNFIIGELYYPGGNDKTVGSILRCLPPKAIQRQKNNPLKFYIFDVWCFDGESLMETPFEKRIDYLLKVQNKLDSLSYYLDTPTDHIYIAEYLDAKGSAYNLLQNVLSRGGEGVVLQRKNGLPEPGKRPARKSLKIKKEIQSDLDVVCMGFNQPTRAYTGIAVEFWPYWEDVKTGEKIHDHMYIEYSDGSLNIEPVTKSYFYGWCGSIVCGVYRDGKLVKVCDVSGLTDDIRADMKEHPDNYLNHPLRISGMEFTEPQKGEQSVRHPRFIGFRDDINAEDCTWEKIFETK